MKPPGSGSRSTPAQAAIASAPPRRRGRILFAAFALLACAGFFALGIWQLQRLEWKRELIARVDARVHAEPGAMPPAARWQSVDARSDEFRRVRLTGHYLDVDDTRVQAVTRLGAGWWLLRPFRTDAGEHVLVNRGFVPTGVEVPALDTTAATQVIGLLRLDEPGGGFLRRNDPDSGRWYSRDTQAMARVLNLREVAPFFIDAEHVGAPDAWPAGGLTVLRFPNKHLPYALTWFTLSGLAAFGAWRVLRDRGRRSRPGRGATLDARAQHGADR